MTLSDQRKEYLYDYQKSKLKRIPLDVQKEKYEEMGKSIDGVIIATADHTHAIITADAMTMGKHVYCAFPLSLHQQ